MSLAGSMPLGDLEAVWERLALAIDEAGREKELLFLSKLALLLADAVADRGAVEQRIAAALADLA